MLLACSLAVAACSGGSAPKGTAAAHTPAARTAAPTAAANACSKAVGNGATTYPGWPGGTNPTGTGDVIPSLVSSQLTVGPNRFLLTVLDKANKVIAAAGVPIDLRFFNLAKDPNTPASTSSGTFLDTGTGSGLYRTTVTFQCSGDWGVEVVVHQASGDTTARVSFNVLPSTTVPAIGALAPGADNPTATDAAGIGRISTDPSPDPDFYRMTITQAITSGKPSLIIFATPAFCVTQVCGPTLQIVKAAAAPFKGRVNMVHVEPYLMYQVNGGLQPVLDTKGQLQIVPAVEVYGLQSEPYTFVVDGSGTVTAEFEGVVGADELTAALQAVAGGPSGSAAPGGSTAPAASTAPAGSSAPAASVAPGGSPASGTPAPGASGYSGN